MVSENQKQIQEESNRNFAISKIFDDYFACQVWQEKSNPKKVKY